MEDRHETHQRESECQDHQADACRDFLNLLRGFHLYRVFFSLLTVCYWVQKNLGSRVS